MKRFITTLLLCVAAVSVIASQPVEKINYQGRLLDGTNLVSGSYQIAFRLYSDVAAGTELYCETQTVEIVDGLYSTAIGNSNLVPGSLLSALKDNVCYLEVEVGGTVLSPREEITAVAHALTAVSKTGDTMTGPLVINAGAGDDIQIFSSGSGVAIGNSANTGSGTARIAIGHNVTNEIDDTAAIRGTLYLDGGTNIYYRSTAGTGVWQELVVEADPVWLLEKGNYATGTPLYAYSETDPSWISSSNDVEIRILNVETSRVSKMGDKMTGTLVMNVGTNNEIIIDSSGSDIAIGNGANTVAGGLAIGYRAFSWYDGVSVGPNAVGSFAGTALGRDANGDSSGVSIGKGALGYANGCAVGYEANGRLEGVAIGRDAKASGRGVAAGRYANGISSGVSIGYNSYAVQTNIAIGYGAISQFGKERISIGHDVVNDTDNSARIRGTLYLDGGTGLMYRSSFGSGGWSVKAFTIDHPLDPQNKVLRHYSMEGPDVWNVYAGNVQVVNGEAVVELPAYYSALNLAGSEIYSFTPVGVPAICYVKQKAANNRFVIGADDDCEVSWTVKARRNDPAAQKDIARRPVEQLKREIPAGPEPSEIEQQNTTVISP